MKRADYLFYPAIFTYDDGAEIAVVFPDLDVATSGVDERDALMSARELLGCVLFGLEEDGEELPTPTPMEQIVTASGERTALIDVFMPAVRMASVNRSVNRTVTLPAWLNAAALERGINFSQLLQDSLKAVLQVGQGTTQ